ncbi:GNAT family N-acetyltransferase [Patescibacteria group bacterium]|nr:GNAT family N-acetyltransferase [Patescibacteria group bacterium]
MNSTNITLAEFDEDFFYSTPGHEELLAPDRKIIYHTVVRGEKKIGVVGFVPLKNNDKAGFVQVLTAPEFRGMGMAEKAETALAEKYKLKTLFATIRNDNTLSIQSHLNMGFEFLPEDEQEELRSKGFLQENEVRLFKHFD